MPSYGDVRAARWRQRVTDRWQARGPSAYERWLYGRPWPLALVTALLAGTLLGSRVRRWTAAPDGLSGEPLSLLGSAIVLLGLLAGGYLRGRASVELYAEWSRQRPVAPGPRGWLAAAVLGAGAFVPVAFASLPERPAPPPDADAVSAAIRGAGCCYELLDGDVPATAEGELSLDESRLDHWYVAARNGDGDCFALSFVAGELDRFAPLAEPCTAQHAVAALG